MAILVLHPGQRSLRYSVVSLKPGDSPRRFRIRDCRGAGDTEDGVQRALLRARRSLRRVTSADGPEAVAIHVLFGGAEFDRAVVADELALARLEGLTPAAPLHLPLAVAVARQCRTTFPAARTVLAFGTAFFVGLPERESRYALDENAVGLPALRRFGYHGLFHQAACAEAAAPRILSLCLESRPEIAAVVNCRPVTVSSGVTPLEGLPGETTCGQVDPGIILDLARRKRWGPEQIDRLLTRRSGLLGLAGGRVSLADVLLGGDERHRLAGEVLRYRIMMHAGAGVAAMGGVDAITFSGRYASLGQTLGPWLCERLTFSGGLDGRRIKVCQLQSSLDLLLAERAVLTSY